MKYLKLYSVHKFHAQIIANSSNCFVFFKQGISDMNENRNTSKINRWISVIRSFRNESPINCGRQVWIDSMIVTMGATLSKVMQLKLLVFLPSNYIWSQIIVRDACVWLRSRYRKYVFLKYCIKYTLHAFLMTAMIIFA